MLFVVFLEAYGTVSSKIMSHSDSFYYFSVFDLLFSLYCFSNLFRFVALSSLHGSLRWVGWWCLGKSEVL